MIGTPMHRRRRILNWILKKYDVMMWTIFIWLQDRGIRRPLVNTVMNVRVHKRRRMS